MKFGCPCGPIFIIRGLQYNFASVSNRSFHMSNKEQRSNKEAKKKPQHSLKEKRAAKKAKKQS